MQNHILCGSLENYVWLGCLYLPLLLSCKQNNKLLHPCDEITCVYIFVATKHLMRHTVISGLHPSSEFDDPVRLERRWDVLVLLNINDLFVVIWTVLSLMSVESIKNFYTFADRNNMSDVLLDVSSPSTFARLVLTPLSVLRDAFLAVPFIVYIPGWAQRKKKRVRLTDDFILFSHWVCFESIIVPLWD